MATVTYEYSNLILIIEVGYGLGSSIASLIILCAIYRNMASGSSSSSRATSSGTASTSAVVLQDMQQRLQRIEQKQTQLQSAIEELKDLMKSNLEESFKVKGSNYQVCAGFRSTGEPKCSKLIPPLVLFR